MVKFILSQRRLPSGLEWQEKSDESGNNEQCSRDVNRDGGREIGVQRSDGSHDSENSVCDSDDGVTGTTVLGGEELGGEGVEDAVHDVVCETVVAVPAQHGVGRTGGGAGEEEDAGKDWEKS